MLRGVVAAVAAVVLAGSPVAAAQPPAPPAPIIPPPVQPANIGDVKVEATRYHDSGAYLTDLRNAAAPAVGWINERAGQVARPAIVLDIDETSLSNWEEIKANDFGRFSAGSCDNLPHGPCGWQAWGERAQATVLGPTMDIFTTARNRGAQVFFITGRPESQRAATERNLQAVGYTGYTELVMTPDHTRFGSAADYKAPQRARITQQGHTIIANVGDQPSDLAGGFAERTFLLPNPFYRIP